MQMESEEYRKVVLLKTLSTTLEQVKPCLSHLHDEVSMFVCVTEMKFSK